MNLKLIEKKEDKIKFLVKGIDSSFANLLRRSVIDLVPTMAIEDVTFVKNTSALYDEFIAHRLGLIPLSTDIKGYNIQSECKCNGKGCARCQLKLVLQAKGPCIVYAENMKSSDPKIKPIYPDMPIVKLLKGQVLQFEANAILGRGRDHTKFSPGLIFHRAVANIDIKNATKIEDVEKICPKKVFSSSGKKLNIVNELDCDLCLACSDLDNKINIIAKNDEFIIEAESWGQLDVKNMILTGLDEFNKKLKELAKELK